MFGFTTRLARHIATMNLATFESTPSVRLARPKAAANTADWTPGCWSGQDRQSSEDDEEADGAVKVPISMFSTAMDNLNQVTNAARVSLVMFQLKTTWDDGLFDKATKAFNLVSDVIAQKARQKMFHSKAKTMLKMVHQHPD